MVKPDESRLAKQSALGATLPLIGDEHVRQNRATNGEVFGVVARTAESPERGELGPRP
jgi:hypothetical protein